MLPLLLLPFAHGAPTWTDSERQTAIAEGAAVMERHQCHRCHEIDDLPAATRPLDCRSCHVFIDSLTPDDPRYQRIATRYGEEILLRYQHKIEHLKETPDLTLLGARLRADWIADYLANPLDLRPALESSMIRTNLEPKERQQIARYFAAMAEAPDPAASSSPPGGAAPTSADPASTDPAKAARGEQLYRERACAACHAFGGRDFGVPPPAVPLAPNLRFVRDRMDPDVVVAWLLDPRKVQPNATMPPLGLSQQDAEAITAFLFHADPELGPVPEPEVSVRLLDRPVPYAEMKEEVLGHICVHCHMNDHEKDPGPGNLGGLGYPGVGLAMRSYDTLILGAVGPDGQRYSVLEPRPGQKYSPLIESMLRRYDEAARDQVAPGADHPRPPYGEPPGMPLGLPAMTQEQIAILHTWISQGCRGPTAASGMAGITDGFLVPEGPGDDNQGCHLREAPERSPAR